MGIHQVKSVLKTYYSKQNAKDPDDYLQKSFSSECLQIPEFLENFWDSAANENFDWTNIQENKKPEEGVKEKDRYNIKEKYLIPELPLNQIIIDNLFSVETISEFKDAHNPSETKRFSNSFVKKMHIMMISFIKKILSTFNENSSLECIGKYFETLNEEKSVNSGLETGMALLIKLLDNVPIESKFTAETIDYLYINSKFIRPLSLWGETKRYFLLDKSLNDISQYLKKILINKTSYDLQFRYKALKILFSLGVAKGSLKNLLDFVSLTEIFDDSEHILDLNYELNLFKSEFIKLSLSHTEASNLIVHSKLWGFNIKSNAKEEERKTDTPALSIATDSTYVYLFSSKGYLAKIGSGYNNTMLGKTYKIKENYRTGEKGTISLIENYLYYRSSATDPNPLVCIDTVTLDEVEQSYQVDSYSPNSIWVEGKKNEMEFPHSSYKEMTEIIEKKKNLGLEDRPNLRSSSASPQTTDGRFIYIFSKWYDEVDAGFDQAGDEEEEGEQKTTKKTTITIYGVNIYDPLANFMHIKSIKLNFKKKTQEPVDLLKSGTILYTNGNIFVIDHFKFNLTTGDEIEGTTPTIVDNLKTACYDLQNNVIWGLTHKFDGYIEKIELNCFFNHSAKPIVEYPEKHPKFMPCSLEKIINLSEEKIKLKQFQNEVSNETFLKQSTLNILNLEDKFSLELKNTENVILKEKEDLNNKSYKLSLQCFILSTIAKLSEFYGQVSDLRSANTDEERGKILASACRRPYCVKLEPEIFEILIQFIDKFSLKFFKKEENQELENFCLLSTVKILRTNLKCLSISALDLELFISRGNKTNPFIKMKEFILKIFKIYHENLRNDDIIKALYEECKIILQVSVNTLYPEYKDIIDLLSKEIANFKESKYSRDIVLCVLEWVSNEENMKNLLRKLEKEEVLKIFEIFKIVSLWEINSFSQYLKKIDSLKEIPRYQPNDSNESLAFKFSSAIQIEILKKLSQKLLNDNYEDIENETLLDTFSQTIFDNVTIIFQDLRKFLEKIPEIIENDWNIDNPTQEELFIDTSKPVEEKKETSDNQPKTFEEFRREKYKEIWNYLKDTVLSQKLLILRTFNFHVDCLSILSSNFVIATLMLKSFNDIIGEMNFIFDLLKEIENNSKKEEISEYKEVYFESDHPYANSTTKWFTIDIPGEKELTLEFDPQCKCKTNCSYVQLYTDMNMSSHVFPEHTTMNENNWPKDPLVVSKPPIYLYFYSDACQNTAGNWGFKVKVHNGKKKSIVTSDDKFTAMMRSVCWVACKNAAQLLRGNFIKIHQDEDDTKYNNILNSKLFSGGIDFEDVRKDNDKSTSNILNIFNNIIPEKDRPFTSPDNQAEKKLLMNILNGEGDLVKSVLNIFQKKFSKEVVWAYIGGDQADRLVRAAFASLLRHSSQAHDFQELINTIEVSENIENSENLDENTYMNLVIKHEKFNSLYKKWQAASRMRTWLIEKKKNVDEALERTKGSSSKKNTPEEEQKEIEEEKKKDQEEKNASDEIFRKIIEQTVIKAKFLLKLNPSPAFQESKDKNSNIFVRNTSFSDNEEDGWKTRLHQWKNVQKSKKILKSVEEEAQENLSSLTSSVLMCLQSTISSKRLLNKIKLSTIRAIGRQIGLISIKDIFEKVTHPTLLQDLLSWFCSALRKTESKICHYMDNLQGCGKEFEERVQESFQDFMILLIQKLINTEKLEQLKSFIDALMWKYSANDHRFLVDQSIFMILWGQFNDPIKTVWGKPLKLPQIEIPEDFVSDYTEMVEFSGDLIQIFEVLANICLERSTVNEKPKKDANKSNYNTLNANIKFPSLERQTSTLDESSSEGLILHILDVIFGEIHKSLQNYLKFRGVSYPLWKQYEKYEEEKKDDKKKKVVQTNPPITEARVTNNNNEIVEDSFEIFDDEIDTQNNEVKEKEKKEELITKENADNPFSSDSLDFINLYDEYRDFLISKSKVGKRTYFGPKLLTKYVFSQFKEVYDSDFLNRLLLILYKCSCNMNEKILFNLVNPLHFSHLLKLLRLCSTPNKILISKILVNVCPQIPEEILIESVDLFVQNNDFDSFLQEFSILKKKLPHNDRNIFIELIIAVISDIKKKIWTKKIESSGGYIVTTHLLKLLQKLWGLDGWNEIFNSIFTRTLEGSFEEDIVRKEVFLSVLGGEFIGQSVGATARIRDENSNQGINFEFIKKDYVDHFNYGTIIGFSPVIEDFWVKKVKESTTTNSKKVKKPLAMYLTPSNNLENSVGVLLNDSLLKDEFNLIDITPKSLSQHQIKIIQDTIDFKALKINKENLRILFNFLCESSESKVSEVINLRTNVIRFLEKFLRDQKGFELLLEMDEEFVEKVINLMTKIAESQLKFSSNYLNLELLEEKRYRLLNMATENSFSLSEIPKLSLNIRKSNTLVLRISNNSLVHLCIPIQGVCNFSELNKFNDYEIFEVDFEDRKSSSDIQVCEVENIDKALSKGKKLIITYNIDSKSLNSKFKKICDSARAAIVVIDNLHYNEIVGYYNSIIINKNNNESQNSIFTQSTGNDLAEELEIFGFSKEIIQNEIDKMKDSCDLNGLINNLLEIKDKLKDEEKNDEIPIEKKIEINNNIEGELIPEKIVEKKVNESEEIKNEEFEIEPKNECFNCVEIDSKKGNTPEFFEEMIFGENEDVNVLYKSFKNLNEKITVLYGRRIVLNLFSKLLSLQNEKSNLIEKVSPKSLLNILKLLAHEGLFLHNINWGSDLLIEIKSFLLKIYSAKIPYCTKMSDYLIKDTKDAVEEILKTKSSSYDFISRNEEAIIQKPMIFFSVWNLMIINENQDSKLEYSFILNILAGLVIKIRENRQIRWFILELLIQLISKIFSNLKIDSEFIKTLSEEKSFKNLENFTKLRQYLDESIMRESKKNLSKRTQMICELLIFVEDLENKFNKVTGKNENLDLKMIMESEDRKDNFVSDLLTTFEMMKEFFDKKYLKFLAWNEINPEIINASKITYESPHLYNKAPHTSLIHIPNTTSLEVNIHSDTLLDNGDTLTFSSDKNCNIPLESFANRYSKKTFNIQSSHIFIHFPSNYINEVYTFGYNSSTRLGHIGSDVFTPKLVDSLSSCIIKDLFIGDTFVTVLTQQGEVLSCGNGLASGLKSLTNNFTRAQNIHRLEKINTENILMLGVYNTSTIVLTQDFNLFSVGNNQFGQLGQGWTNPVTEITTMSFQKRIKQICVAETHSMIVTQDHNVYSIGSNDYYQNGDISARTNNPRLINLEKNLLVLMVSAGENFTIFLVKDKITSKTKLYSAGDVKNGKTGQGKEESFHVFKQISTTELDKLEWKYICSSRNGSAAITNTGKLYVWGLNSRGQLGLGHYNNVNEPTQVTFFDKFTVEDVTMASDHTLVLAKDQNGKVSVYAFGDSSNGKLGETVTQKAEKKDTCPTPIKISFFEGKSPSKVFSGPRASAVICKPKSYDYLRDHHNLTCSLCSKNVIIGNLFIEFTEELKYYCNDCAKIAELSEQIPRVLLKSPVKEELNIKQFISTLKTFVIDSNLDETPQVSCKSCKNVSIVGNQYFYIYIENQNRNYLCTECIDTLPSCLTGVKVYLKTKILYKNLDFLEASNLYDTSISYGYKFSITPILNEKGCESVIEKHSASYNNFIDDLNDYNKFEVYEQFVDLLNNIAQKAEKSIFTYSPKDLSFKKEDLSVRSSIEKCSPDLLRKMFVILKILNNRVKELLPFIDFSKVLSDNQRLSYYFNKVTPLIFWDTKNEIIKYYLEKTSTDCEVSELKINRMKARRFIDKGKPDHTGEYTVFGQMYQFLKTKNFKIFKKKEGGNNNKMFNVTFVGEASIDAGGPYREALSQICTEMQSSSLPLFIPSPNQKNESGLFREKWIVSPSAKSITHLEMLKYIGGLIGYAMRTGEFLNLDLPSIFWKQLLEAPLERKDLEYIDRYTIQCLDDIINIHKKGVSQDNFNFFVDQKFTTCLSDGTEVELIPEGNLKEVTFAERVKYCELVEKIRLEESKVQMNAIRSGLEQVIPLGLLKLLSWKELETLVCGKPILDIELLKQNSIYRGCSENDSVIQYFWKCLDEFSPEERSMYLRFVWGRSRLPLTSKDFTMKHRIEILHHNNPDVALPTSHTCFFSVEIPKYSSYELLKEKLKYAITNCQAIDTDGRAYEIWQDED